MNNEERLVNLWNEYQNNKDAYTPEQQTEMENKFGTLVQKAMAEKEANKPQAEAKPRYTKAPEQKEQKPYRVSL